MAAAERGDATPPDLMGMAIEEALKGMWGAVGVWRRPFGGGGGGGVGGRSGRRSPAAAWGFLAGARRG